MERSEYEDYVDAFNSKDYERMVGYYADDVDFILNPAAGLVFKGKDAILGLYRPFHQAVEERVDIVNFADGGNCIFAEVDATFKPIPGKEQSVIDLPHGKGLPVTTFAIYDLDADGKFNRIRACSYSRHYADA